MRENPIAMGAGADRISDGMRLSFGRPIGTAARVSAGQKIMTLQVAKDFGALAKKALGQATLKLPLPCRLVVERGQELLQ